MPPRPKTPVFSSTRLETRAGPVSARVAGPENGTPFLALPGLGRSGNPDWEVGAS
jgi:hypothetical protein